MCKYNLNNLISSYQLLALMVSWRRRNKKPKCPSIVTATDKKGEKTLGNKNTDRIASIISIRATNANHKPFMYYLNIQQKIYIYLYFKNLSIYRWSIKQQFTSFFTIFFISAETQTFQHTKTHFLNLIKLIDAIKL